MEYKSDKDEANDPFFLLFIEHISFSEDDKMLNQGQCSFGS